MVTEFSSFFMSKGVTEPIALRDANRTLTHCIRAVA
jgi:hypothetical protein